MSVHPPVLLHTTLTVRPVGNVNPLSHVMLTSRPNVVSLELTLALAMAGIGGQNITANKGRHYIYWGTSLVVYYRHVVS